ncbi:flagellar filament capping protein FliD [Anaerotignum sp.]|uniref:flagellar filament capping protein FliD n=1 Tax=Anaerotignum sp. TaxID=2039241 RepID=UPI002714741A|nr:flagellar filament capping protein FliD [Anaerotignum sp.]
MATINSLTSTSSSSNAYGSTTKGIGGLVSGLDTDEIIDGMTIATRSKIAKQKQSKTLLSWKTDAYRAISDKLVSFADKYTSYSSGTNLNSSGFYSRSVITATGENGDCVSVTGKVSSGQQLSIEGIKQLAQDASFTTTEALSNNYIQTDAINFGTEDSCTLVGKSFTVKYGSTSYSVTMPEKEGGGLYTSAAEVAAGITKALEKVDIGSGKNLSDVMSVTASGETLNFKNIDGIGNELKITSGDSELLSHLGINSGNATIVDQSITDGGLDAAGAINPDDLHENTTFKDRMLNKSLIFEYNGEKQTITFDDETKLNETDFLGYLQEKLDTAFGNGRIQLTQDADNKIQMKTILPSGVEDNSSVLYVTSSSLGVLGEGSVFGIENGAINKVSLTSSLEESGIKDVESAGLVDGTEYEIRINGASIKFTYKEGETTINDILSAINSNEDADVNISYQANSDSFSVVSTQHGASGSVEIGGSGGELNAMERLLFGKRDGDGKIDPVSNEVNGKTVEGQDAIILVDFDGEGGADAMEIARGTNSFSLNGMKIVAKETFGYEENGLGELEYVEGTEAIKFDASADTDKIVDAIKNMVTAYNEMVEASNTAIQEKRDRDYAPLTDEQKEDMSDSEIEAWETKAKKGMLFGDSDVSNLANDLRFVFMNTSSDGFTLADIGITISSDWEDNGKITLDESKLESALQEDPENVKQMFTDEMEDGNLLTGGFMARMKFITDKYASTVGATKGILVEKAGNSSSPSSLLKNTLQTKMDDIDDIIETLEDKLETERTRYQNQFTQLEVMMQKLNSQSGWLSDYSSY